MYQSPIDLFQNVKENNDDDDFQHAVHTVLNHDIVTFDFDINEM
jgi:hypothetical protein